MAIVFPNIFKDGTGMVASGAQVMENLNTLREALELGSASTAFPWTQKKIIATSQSTASASYVLLGTPDEVTLVLGTDGLIFIAYQATWSTTIASQGNAAIFLGENQLKSAANSGAPAVLGSPAPAGTLWTPLSTYPAGLTSGDGSVEYTGDVTTGQLVAIGGSAGVLGPIFAAAGTYKVSVRFKVGGGGSVSAKNRKLWAWVAS